VACSLQGWRLAGSGKPAGGRQRSAAGGCGPAACGVPAGGGRQGAALQRRGGLLWPLAVWRLGERAAPVASAL